VIDDDLIEQHLEGRLRQAHADAFEARLAAEPQLRMLVEEMRCQAFALRGLGAEILDEPLPARLLAVLAPLKDPAA
jgi:anti-sigma factor RsiW